jgi:acyl-coenzyme A synthetase/AMP-(fatty) acid ligase
VAQGYWNDPERTAQRFRGGEVWSGDTMVVGADGLLRFRGRDDAMIKVSGNRISPTEIEEAALTSGTVRDAAAFGVPDERFGQAIVLVVVGDGDEAALRTYLKRELPAHMQPTRIVWHDALPTGPNGKLDRAALQAAL